MSGVEEGGAKGDGAGEGDNVIGESANCFIGRRLSFTAGWQVYGRSRTYVHSDTFDGSS